jgi:hypothetical protein
VACGELAREFEHLFEFSSSRLRVGFDNPPQIWLALPAGGTQDPRQCLHGG